MVSLLHLCSKKSLFLHALYVIAIDLDVEMTCIRIKQLHLCRLLSIINKLLTATLKANGVDLMRIFKLLLFLRPIPVNETVQSWYPRQHPLVNLWTLLLNFVHERSEICIDIKSIIVPLWQNFRTRYDLVSDWCQAFHIKHLFLLVADFSRSQIISLLECQPSLEFAIRNCAKYSRNWSNLWCYILMIHYFNSLKLSLFFQRIINVSVRGLLIYNLRWTPWKSQSVMIDLTFLAQILGLYQYGTRATVIAIRWVEIERGDIVLKILLIQVSYWNNRLLFWRQNFLLMRLSSNYTMVTQMSLLFYWIRMSAIIHNYSFDIDS